MKVLLLDTETDGTDETSRCIEVAVAVYDLDHAAVVRSFASLIHAESNAAEHVNRIPPALLATAPKGEVVWRAVHKLASECSAVLAHNAAFDERFVPSGVITVPWVCTQHDITWPRDLGGALVKIALGLDLGVSHAHRASVDVDLIGRCLTRARELGMDLEAAVTRGMRPKRLFVSLAPIEEKDVVKAHGFTWKEIVPGKWAKRMPPEDVEGLPFKVVEAA